jgi:two-component system, OmpR family, sensor histidine kinase BaeS
MKRAADSRNMSVSRMRRTIEDLADFRSIELGVMTLDRRPTDLRALVEHVVRGLDRNERNRVVIECRSTAIVAIDAARVSRVLWRLFHLHLTTATAGSHVQAVIENAGDRATIGLFSASTLAASAMRLVLDAANQRYRSRGEQLGVAVARHAVEAHGGVLTAYEQPGKGTWLIVMLPVAHEAAA